MRNSLTAIIAAAILTLTSQLFAQKREFNYDFRVYYLWDKLLPILNGKFSYNNNDKEIRANIDSIKVEKVPKLIKPSLAEFKKRSYRTVIGEDSIFYTEEIEGNKPMRKSFCKGSPYLDVLTSAQILLDYIEKDSVEYHQLLKDKKLDLVIQDSLRSVKLISFNEINIKYEGEKVKAKRLSVYGCPDDSTFFKVIYHQGRVIQIEGSSKKIPGIRIKAELKYWFKEE
jgi:hypothetical protein